MMNEDRTAGADPARRRRVLPPQLATYLVVMAIFVAGWALTTPGRHFWPIWPAIGWGIPLFSRLSSAERR
jgi:hypothetical protein